MLKKSLLVLMAAMATAAINPAQVIASAPASTKIPAIENDALELLELSLMEEQEKNYHYYAKTAIVTVLDETDDYVILKDANGQSWYFSGVEDWMVGDVASLLMYDNGTVTIYDDEIINARYSGFSSSEIR